MSDEILAMKSIGELFSDLSIRPDRIFHLGTQGNPEAPAQDLVGAIEDFPEEIFLAIGVTLNSLNSLDDSLTDLLEFLESEDKRGFLVEFGTPVPRFHTNGSPDYAFSWGTYSVTWIYAETYQEACEKAVEWRNQYIDSKEKENAN